MTKELEKIEELTNLVREQYEQNKQLLFIARDSMNDKGYSDAIYQLQKEVKSINEKLEALDKKYDERDTEMRETMEPIAKAFTSVDGTARVIVFVAKLGLSFGTIVGLIIGIKQFLKT